MKFNVLERGVILGLIYSPGNLWLSSATADKHCSKAPPLTEAFLSVGYCHLGATYFSQ